MQNHTLGDNLPPILPGLRLLMEHMLHLVAAHNACSQNHLHAKAENDDQVNPYYDPQGAMDYMLETYFEAKNEQDKKSPRLHLQQPGRCFIVSTQKHSAYFWIAGKSLTCTSFLVHLGFHLFFKHVCVFLGFSSDIAHSGGTTRTVTRSDAEDLFRVGTPGARKDGRSLFAAA